MPKTLFLCLLLLAAARVASAQTGGVAGRVMDQTGGVLPGVTIELVAEA